MDAMLEKAGIGKMASDEELGGPTSMHNLLQLVQKEQDIYNIIFHELIRQVCIVIHLYKIYDGCLFYAVLSSCVYAYIFITCQVSVHCIERGQLLSELRTRYSNLLNRIPRQVKE